MRNILSTTLIGMLCLTPVIAFAADPPKRGEKEPSKAAQRKAKVDEAAAQVFAQFEKQKIGWLGPLAFSKAEPALEEKLMQLANQGVLGDLSEHKKPGSAAAAAPPDLSKKKQITLSDFQQYAQALAEQVDASARNQRQLMQAKQKAMMQRASRGKYGGS